MSSPDHPTANLEDAFSSNFPNYVPPASPDYIPTSPGKTYSSASNLFGIAPPTLSLFPDDPYMKNLQAFYNENQHPNIIPPKTQEFFLPEGLLSPMQLSPSTPSQPQALEIGETSRKSAIKRHEEQIQECLQKESNCGATAGGGYDQDVPSRKLVADSVTSALEAQATTMASASNPDRNTVSYWNSCQFENGNYKEFISCQPF
ncbi:hypothetical protein Tco_1522452 [Tanacetum coccineum]